MKAHGKDHSSVGDTPKLSAGVQIGISIGLLIHLLAVFIAPMRIASGNSPAVRPVAATLDPYINLMYLNHGYAFFAPDPGPNHPVRYELEFADGREALIGEFPDRTSQWPRLLYHRHFMLAETLYRLAPGPRPREPRGPVDDSRAARRMFERQHDEWEEALAQWQSARDLYERVRGSMMNHLQRAYGSDEVVLIRREHRPLEIIEFTEDRLDLRDNSTYRDLPESSAAEELPWNPAPSR